ncbi:TetR family transcriptional regulator [Streptomyces sulfonofaciens]|uniref:TetR family transcriptional regulator n=1 Tax=Streptomyces sulfonofaciens TaxID=68272 RepID=A0A919L3T1_9ACTN|nr:TetR/AcrR family transcriptional regulator [Streptomyces sulfonofaciens]GHH82812.1 TetR family transcriptional regulator [Streptomyces sulfonofaciens]
METSETTAGARRGGRGARERILRAAVELFARDGIHATGIAKLTEVAHVSTRTLYQHFPSKEALVSAYLQQVESDLQGPVAVETALERGDLSARERLLELFAEDPAGSPRAEVVRGCPFHNAAVETAGTMPEAAALVERHKKELTARLISTSAEAGAHEPETLGRQLAVLFEGARALSTSLNDARPFRDARELARTLINQATGPT